MPGYLRRRSIALVIAFGLLAGLAPQPAHAAPPTLATAAIASGLAIPWDVAFLPDGKMLVTERPGRIRVYASGSPGAALVRTITVPAVRAEGEAGLMGIAVDTSFAANPYVYVCASRQYSGSGGWRNEVLRYRLDTAGGWSGPTRILGGMLANTIHNGCAVEMDQSGRLWVSMGDADQEHLAQNRSSLNGKILRMNRDGGTPIDNPVMGGVRNVVYSMGHRNPQGIAFRPGTNQVYAVEHGPQPAHGDDEINLLAPGGNYGWPCYTGFGRSYLPAVCGNAPATSYLDPAWSSGAGVTLATSGGTFVGGSQWADFNGNLFVSTLKERDLRRFTVSAGGSATAAQTLYNGSWGRLRAAVLGPGGQLYVTTSNGSGDRVIRISPRQPNVERIAGANRYETAERLAEIAYPGTATEVVVATGEDFPDALAGSAAAGMRGMPVLLTMRNELPEPTRRELDRLNPTRVWVLGGTSVISESVRSQISTYASSGEAIRISGADRYATAAEIADRWYSTGVAAAFIAVGTNFADALAGAPAAALRDSPLLLVRSGGIPAETVDALQTLQPQRIYILGGTAVIGQAVATQLDAYTTGPVTRLAGADRYATANAIVRTFWTKVPTVYVASGTNFPDALAGGAVAGKNGEPMVLAGRGDVPWASGQSVLQLSPRSVNILGGTAALSTVVEATLRRLVATP